MDLVVQYLPWLLSGTLYGFFFGIVPVAGTATALITIFSFLDVFRADPYTLVVFSTAIVVASTIGDSFSSVVLNIPGAGGSAATMVDGFPMAKRGEAGRALSASIVTSTVNGFIWGAMVFVFLPLYATLILKFGIPEMLMFLLLAFSCVCFINSEYWFRGIIALVVGIFAGLVGIDPISGSSRLTGGWDYLANGIQLIPVLAGILAFPELVEAYKKQYEAPVTNSERPWQQIWQGFVDSWQHKWDGLRGGAIGAIVGVIPGIGGSIADWLAYSQTVALNKNEKIPFGEGNIKGVVGSEGANNAQKATSYVPTILFGVPGAPFEVVLMSLFVLVGLELGTPTLLTDAKFFNMLTYSYMLSMTLTFIISILFIRYAIKFMAMPFKYYFWPIIALLLWSSVQYTGYWEDYLMFAICCILGIVIKYLKLSRAALIVGFALSDQLEKMLLQYNTLYAWDHVFYRPISFTLFVITLSVIVYGIFFNKTKISYI
jgi:putative tricarboxylic transport membrane protein